MHTTTIRPKKVSRSVVDVVVLVCIDIFELQIILSGDGSSIVLTCNFLFSLCNSYSLFFLRTIEKLCSFWTVYKLHSTTHPPPVRLS